MTVMCGWEKEKMVPSVASDFLPGKTGCRKDHSLWQETQEEGRKARIGGEDHKARFGSRI